MKPIDKIDAIKMRLQIGIISYDEAFELAGPFIEELNAQIKEMAIKNKMPYKPVSFIKLMR